MAVRKKRLIFAIIFGLLLAFLIIWIIGNIYDPFSEDVEDVALLLPEDIDFFIEVEDFPTFVKGLENREFYSRLDRNRDFQSFLQSPKVNETGFVPLLSKALAEITRANASSELPFSLELLGDISGTQVVVGGYFPKDPESDLSIMACIKPDSAWGIVGANVLLNETLFGWFVESEVPDWKVVHRNWGAEITVTQNGETATWGLARLENALVFGNDLAMVKRSANRVQRDGILFERPDRLTGAWVFEAPDDNSIKVVVARPDRASEDRLAVIDRFLRPLWGAEATTAFESLFPLFEGEDRRLGLEIDDRLGLRVEIETRPRSQASPFSKFGELDTERIETQISNLVSKLPHYVFSYGHVAAKPGDLIEHVLRQPDLIDKDKRSLWFEELSAKMPRFASAPVGPEGIPDLTILLREEFNALFEEGIGFVLFKKERDDGGTNSQPGFAAILEVKDRSRLEAFIEEIDQLAGEGDRPLDRIVDEGRVYWRVANTAFLDDSTNNRPGFALIGNQFVMTNWYRMLEDSRGVAERQIAGFGNAEEVRELLRDPEPWWKSFLYLDAARLYAYMDDAKAGWVAERKEIKDEEIFAQARQFELEADRRRIPAGQRDGWIDQQMEIWLRKARQQRNEQAIAHEIDRNLNYFRAAFEGFSVVAGQEEDLLRVELGLSAARH